MTIWRVVYTDPKAGPGINSLQCRDEDEARGAYLATRAEYPLVWVVAPDGRKIDGEEIDAWAEPTGN